MHSPCSYNSSVRQGLRGCLKKCLMWPPECCHLIPLCIFLYLFCRMESEISKLETQEMNISENEELILKELKKVEKTTEDIIKVLLG